VLVNTLRGPTSVNPRAIELMESYAAGQIEIFRRVRIPTALPFIFTGLKVATVLAMIGAVVGEYFGGALNALGVLILTRSRVFEFNEAWAGIFLACLLGLALYVAVALLERLTLRWVPSTSE
jgi:NitT/TauT family transport system permease protein